MGLEDRSGSIATFWLTGDYFRSSPASGHRQDRSPCLKRATSELMRCSNRDPYSMVSSAIANNVGGTVRPSALTALRLIASSNLVGI